jgi:putative transposase
MFGAFFSFGHIPLTTEQLVRCRGTWKSKSVKQAQAFLNAHAAVSNLFNLGGDLVRAQYYRDLRMSAFSEWSRAVARD